MLLTINPRSLIIDDLLHHLETVSDERFGYFYCDRHEADRQDPDAIFRAILKQLSHVKTGCIHPHVVEHYRASKREGFPSGELAIGESTDLILKLLEVCPKTTIVIDALDECDFNRREDLLESLQKILIHAPNLVKIFVSSRDDKDITRQYAALPNLYIQANDNIHDINAYVDYKIDESIRKRKLLDGKLSPELKELIVRTIQNGANGMFEAYLLTRIPYHVLIQNRFLWANLQIKSLCELSLESDVRDRCVSINPSKMNYIANIRQGSESYRQHWRKHTQKFLITRSQHIREMADCSHTKPSSGSCAHPSR